MVLDVVDDILGVEKTDVLRAGEIVQNSTLLSARDALHIAVMQRHGIRSVLSFDADFALAGDAEDSPDLRGVYDGHAKLSASCSPLADGRRISPIPF